MASQQPRKILRNKGIRPLKRLGQSFLEDKNVIRKIVDAADLQRDDVVVEIGAGMGIMTELVAAKAGRVVALEIDPYMIPILQGALTGRSNVEIVQTDVLKYDFSKPADEYRTDKLKIIGNVPYNISSQILFHVLTFRNCISSMLMMFQKEMADRIMASPGKKDYGIPSVLVNMYARISLEMSIPGTCFFPPPKVESSVLKFLIREKPCFALADENIFAKVVKAAFSQRRKTILNNFRQSDLLDRSDRQAHLLLDHAEIDGQRRAETLSCEEYAKLANVLAKMAASSL
ncbi:MAG: ribosomal RNA small subunit methyltransferase A [Deltaproteobacteria bacterium]|nr:ribosomal RNA small subunit methyltransferase A [Deltaproteobacteria bacterium]